MLDLFLGETLGIIVILLITGIFSGFVAGLLGIGGGIIMVPFTAFILTKTQPEISTAMHSAIATSLAVIISTSFVSARTHVFLGNVDFFVVRKLALYAIIGGFSGAIIARFLDNSSLKILFGFLCIIFGVIFLIRIIVIHNGLPNTFFRAFIGVIVGLISSLVGIGGGSLMVPALTAFGWTMHRAVGTAAFMGLLIAIPGMTSFAIMGADIPGRPTYSFGYVWLPGALCLATTSFFMAVVGAKTADKMNRDKLRKIFGIVLSIVGFRIAYSGLKAGGFGFYS